jgi:hypothetical protein
MKQIALTFTFLSSFILLSCVKDINQQKKKVVPPSYESIDLLIKVEDTNTALSFNITSITIPKDNIFDEGYYCDFGDSTVDSFRTNIGGDIHHYTSTGDYHVKFYFKPSSLTNGIMVGNSFITQVPKTFVTKIENNNFFYLPNLTSIYLAYNNIESLQTLTLPSTITRLVFNGNKFNQSSVDNLLQAASAINTTSKGIIRVDFQRPQVTPSNLGLSYKQMMINKGWIVNTD